MIDEDTTYVGTDAVRGWLDTAASEFTFTRTLLGAESFGGGSWLVRNRLDGNFPGATAELRCQFELRGDLIDRLEIAPERRARPVEVAPGHPAAPGASPQIFGW